MHSGKKSCCCLYGNELDGTKMFITNFRVSAPEGEFQIAMDCTYRPNDVVPIIGKTLLISFRWFECFLLMDHIMGPEGFFLQQKKLRKYTWGFFGNVMVILKTLAFN